MSHKVKLIAFYFPQFHQIAENDEFWGEGFTDWTNVRKARPLFEGHYQPHEPSELGYYDLRNPEIRNEQAELAGKYGIYGFCYYHYWFEGRELLQEPLAEVVRSGQPDFPFCICWANEPWTRTWDGRQNDVLIAQNYSEEDDAKHIASLIPMLKDPRYIRIGGKPLLVVYRTEDLPNPKRTASIWQNAAQDAGLNGLYLARVESISAIDPATIGFDAAIEFAPDWNNLGPPLLKRNSSKVLAKSNVIPEAFESNNVFRYQQVAQRMLAKSQPHYVRFPGITPSWDNSPRRASNAAIFLESDPSKYEQWLQTLVARCGALNNPDERVIFVNAWNEWGEGCHLEPDKRYGRAFLEATLRAIEHSKNQ